MPIRYRRYEPTAEFFRDLTGTVVVSDPFDRSVTDGWGTAPVGGLWEVVSGVASDFQVSGSAGNMYLDGASKSITLDSVNVRDIDILIDFRFSREPVGGGHGIGIRTRFYYNPSDNGYRLRVICNTNLTWSWVLERIVSSAATTITSGTVTGLAAAVGVVYSLRLQTYNASPTTIRGRMWRADSYEPSSWLVNTTDSTAGLQVSGTFNVRARAESGLSETTTYSVDRIVGTQL